MGICTSSNSSKISPVSQKNVITVLKNPTSNHQNEKFDSKKINLKSSKPNPYSPISPLTPLPTDQYTHNLNNPLTIATPSIPIPLVTVPSNPNLSTSAAAPIQINAHILPSPVHLSPHTIHAHPHNSADPLHANINQIPEQNSLYSNDSNDTHQAEHPQKEIIKASNFLHNQNKNQKDKLIDIEKIMDNDKDKGKGSLLEKLDPGPVNIIDDHIRYRHHMLKDLFSNNKIFINKPYLEKKIDNPHSIPQFDSPKVFDILNLSFNRILNDDTQDADECGEALLTRNQLTFTLFLSEPSSRKLNFINSKALEDQICIHTNNKIT